MKNYNFKGYNMRRPTAAGNWKMNGLRENFDDIFLIDAASKHVNCDVILCVPDTLVRIATVINLVHLLVIFLQK